MGFFAKKQFGRLNGRQLRRDLSRWYDVINCLYRISPLTHEGAINGHNKEYF